MIKKAKKAAVDMAVFLEKHYKMMVALMMSVYFAKSLVDGLIKGGRWDLYQNIAMADRFLNGQGFYYSPVEASSPYFPGVAFLAIFIGKFFYPWRDYILLVIASLTGTVFLYALMKLGEKFSNNKLMSLAVVFILMSTGFDSYRSYMNEFKADSLLLLYAILIVLVIDKVEKDEWKAGIGTFIGLFALAFLMDVTKQQALYADVALGGYLLLAKRLMFKEKAIILGSLIMAGLLDLAVIFSIPGIEIQTVENLKNMPYWDMKSIIIMMGRDFIDNIVYFALLFLFVCLFAKKRVRMDTFAWKWLVIALAFGVGQIVGGWKIGGNEGNYEVGMTPFLPFTVVAADYFFQKYFVDSKKKIIKGVMSYAVCGICIMVLAKAGGRLDALVSKFQSDREVSLYLSQELESETVMYFSNQYMQLARSTAKPGMDILSIPYYTEKYFHMIEGDLKDQTYKYLYIDVEIMKQKDKDLMFYFGKEVDSYGMLEKYYEEISDPDMPESLKGQLFAAK